MRILYVVKRICFQGGLDYLGVIPVIFSHKLDACQPVGYFNGFFRRNVVFVRRVYVESDQVHAHASTVAGVAQVGDVADLYKCFECHA